jgi:lysozyme
MAIENDSLIRRITAQLVRDEGLRLNAYRDGKGKLTIGYGHNLDANPVAGLSASSTLTDDQALRLLHADILDAMRRLETALPWSASIDDARFGVLVNMAFNLGIDGLLTFRKTLALVRDGHYTDAGAEMLDSVWAGQVKGRARRLAKQMATGVWQ